MDKENILKTIAAGIGTGVIWLFGTWDIAMVVLVGFMVLDYATGLLKAYINKVVSSEVGLKGITRKGLILVVLVVGVMLDRLINSGSWVFRTLVCYFYIANEGISLLENCAQLGVPIPGKLKNALVQLREGNKEEINDKQGSR